MKVVVGICHGITSMGANTTPKDQDTMHKKRGPRSPFRLSQLRITSQSALYLPLLLHDLRSGYRMRQILGVILQQLPTLTNRKIQIHNAMAQCSTSVVTYLSVPSWNCYTLPYRSDYLFNHFGLSCTSHHLMVRLSASRYTFLIAEAWHGIVHVGGSPFSQDFH